jgi:hypothetical protein
LHTCAVRSNTMRLYCWGNNGNLQCSIPPDVANSAWLAVSAGYYHTCGILLNGTMRCFGAQAGSAVPDGYTWSAVSCGDGYTCGIVAVSGKLMCFGDNSARATVPSNLQNAKWTQVAAGSSCTCGILEGGAAKCFGSVTTVPADVSAWSSVSVGGAYACGLSVDKHWRCWGTPDIWGATTEPSNTTSWVSVALGHYHTCGVEAGTGTMVCVGSNFRGERDPPAGITWSSVSGGGMEHTCGITAAGKLRCFGDNRGQNRQCIVPST